MSDFFFFFSSSRVPPPPPSDPCVHLREANYVPMTPLAPPPPAHPTPATGDPPSLGKRVPPPAHAGFRSHPLTPAAPLTPPPLRRAAAESPGGGGGEATPPPIHRDLKPQRRGEFDASSGQSHMTGHMTGPRGEVVLLSLRLQTQNQRRNRSDFSPSASLWFPLRPLLGLNYLPFPNSLWKRIKY